MVSTVYLFENVVKSYQKVCWLDVEDQTIKTYDQVIAVQLKELRKKNIPREPSPWL